jgi:hypothetical protein
MRDAHVVREAFTLLGLIRPGEQVAPADEKFALCVLGRAPKTSDRPVWLAQQLARPYELAWIAAHPAPVHTVGRPCADAGMDIAC